MNTVHLGEGYSSAMPNIFNQVDYPLQDYDFCWSDSGILSKQDDLSFDPPCGENACTTASFPYDYLGQDSLYTGGWPEIKLEDGSPTSTVCTASTVPTHDPQKTNHLNPSDNATSFSNFNQFAPTSSKSNSSNDHTNEQGISPRTPQPAKQESQRQSKRPPKEVQQRPTSKAVSGRRRRRTTYKAGAAIGTGRPVIQRIDSKRRQSLEKNRRAAAKCRMNKKEKQEQLQRSSHEKVVHNAYLKEEIFRMKEQLQQMNAVLLTHVNCDVFKSPNDVLEHLNKLGNERFTACLSITNLNLNLDPDRKMSSAPL